MIRTEVRSAQHFLKAKWSPDSFGYSWQLPQIYKKSGIDYFVTQKVYSNDTTKFPHKLSWWEAPDGSRLLAYIPHDYANDTDPVKMATDLAAFAPAMYTSDPPGGREMMYLYGVGDHGGGPTRSMLDTAKRWISGRRDEPRAAAGSGERAIAGLQDVLRSPAAKATTGSSGLVRGSADTLENERVRVRVDTKTGCITSLFDKQSNSEALAPPETNTGCQKNSICGNPAASVSRQAKRF